MSMQRDYDGYRGVHSGSNEHIMEAGTNVVSSEDVLEEMLA